MHLLAGVEGHPAELLSAMKQIAEEEEVQVVWLLVLGHLRELVVQDELIVVVEVGD